MLGVSAVENSAQNTHRRGAENAEDAQRIPTEPLPNDKESRLQKLFSTFPSEWPGLGLLLLRVLVAVRLTVQGVGYLQTPNRTLSTWTMAALAFACATFLLAGLMTSLIALLVALGSIAIVVSWVPFSMQDLFGGNSGLADLIFLALAILFLGPGAFSVDARMFGRREITIPISSHDRKSRESGVASRESGLQN